MVSSSCRLLLFFLFFSSLSAQDVIVESTVDQNQGIVDQPISGTLSITHKRGELVDSDSFKFQGQPLSGTLTKEVEIAPGKKGTVISIYQFLLPAKPKGLYTLGPISAKVGDKTYQSSATTYEVRDRKTLSTPSSTRLSSTKPSGPVIFKIEAFTQRPSPLYPGQRAYLIYRIAYNRSIDLSYSDLPLSHTHEFQKIGDEQIKDYQEGDLTYQDIVQEIQAFKPGTFSYGPSVIEGYAYHIDELGQKIYLDTKLRAEAPGVEITVEPFPLVDQPTSFNGGIGILEAQLKLITPLEDTFVNLGDLVELELRITGVTNLEEVYLPLLECQPGFSGFFEFNDLPTFATIKNGSKYFKIQLRPISNLIEAIPSIELSSFDPKTVSYSIWRSDPITLKIKPTLLSQIKKNTALLLASAPPSQFKWPESQIAPPIEIQGAPAPLVDLRTSWLATAWALIAIPLAALLLLLQWIWHKKLKSSHQKRPLISGDDLINRALDEQQPLDILDRVQLMKQALQLKGYLPSENLGDEKMRKEIDSFILYLDSLQYGFQKEFDFDQFRRKVNQLLELLRN